MHRESLSTLTSPSHCSMSRIALARIPSLTFYKDSLTTSRRGSPISQLTCIGKPCRLYQPDVVRCTNSGGSGTDVDWKCEADLPESLRLGRVEVSCEGWDGPGDPYVLKGEHTLNVLTQSILTQGKARAGWSIVLWRSRVVYVVEMTRHILHVSRAGYMVCTRIYCIYPCTSAAD